MRTVIDIDEGALRYAMEELGTTTKVDTVNEALRRVAGDRLRKARMQWWLEQAPDVEEVERDRREGWER
ncbi:MAG: type II toxin-antitoxin system VapB family antitoxin [Micromonosporaceae bacterium]